MKVIDDNEFEDDTLEEYNDEDMDTIDSGSGSSDGMSNIRNALTNCAKRSSRYGWNTPDGKGKRITKESRNIIVKKELKRIKMLKLTGEY
ncbi:hypothetical protein PanWU01x14_328960 [Parasponia andersonii]|uniref:Uncharacterized protein n=1 Tax=Parasponia andersonii TaxID=3476 RepID=A0A2P5AIM5_PARAD|nr:hypothetical protein PanWU01x14_328960 [Parasponia andersonii]